MNPCARHHRIQDWLDGELPPAEAAEFRAHAADCPHCAAEIAAYQRVFRSLGTIPLVEPAPELTERIFARVSPARSRGRFVRALGCRVTVLHEGAVLAEGTLDQVSTNERVIEVYLGR